MPSSRLKSVMKVKVKVKMKVKVKVKVKVEAGIVIQTGSPEVFLKKATTSSGSLPEAAPKPLISSNSQLLGL